VADLAEPLLCDANMSLLSLGNRAFEAKLRLSVLID